jgi:hypothetical protein
MTAQRVQPHNKVKGSFQNKFFLPTQHLNSQQQQKYFASSFMSLHQIAHIDEILDRIFVHLDTPILVQTIQLVCIQWNIVSEEHIDYIYNNN